MLEGREKLEGLHDAGKFSGRPSLRLATRELRNAVIPRCRHLRAAWSSVAWEHWGKAWVRGFAGGGGFDTRREGIGQAVGKKIYACIVQHRAGV